VPRAAMPLLRATGPTRIALFACIACWCSGAQAQAIEAGGSQRPQSSSGAEDGSSVIVAVSVW
jgi:hypothetical protein